VIARRSRLERGLRLTAALLHFLAALLVAAFWYPLISERQRLQHKSVWSARLLRILGIERRVVGAIEPGTLLVANHVSWLDIFVINAANPSAFVAKAEIGSWPLAGWLCRKTDTLFIERGRRRHAQHVAHAMVTLLASDKSVAVFPEGMTSDGQDVLPFHAALLQPAISLERPVQPLAIRYRDANGDYSAAVAYVGETSLMDSLRNMLAVRGLRAELVCLPAIPSRDRDRRWLTKACEMQIRGAVRANEEFASAA
jgi:1-acyl-sn-glycerol-3-phosphate acyltransferase